MRFRGGADRLDVKEPSYRVAYSSRRSILAKLTAPGVALVAYQYSKQQGRSGILFGAHVLACIFIGCITQAANKASHGRIRVIVLFVQFLAVSV